MSHPATIHDPLTVPAARAMLARLVDYTNQAADNASDDLRAILNRTQYALVRGDFLEAAEWLIRLNADTISDPPEDPGDFPEGPIFWLRNRSIDDDLQVLAEDFGELTMGVEKSYWEITLPLSGQEKMMKDPQSVEAAASEAEDLLTKLLSTDPAQSYVYTLPGVAPVLLLGSRAPEVARQTLRGLLLTYARDINLPMSIWKLRAGGVFQDLSARIILADNRISLSDLLYHSDEVFLQMARAAARQDDRLLLVIEDVERAAPHDIALVARGIFATMRALFAAEDKVAPLGLLMYSTDAKSSRVVNKAFGDWGIAGGRNVYVI